MEEKKKREKSTRNNFHPAETFLQRKLILNNNTVTQDSKLMRNLGMGKKSPSSNYFWMLSTKQHSGEQPAWGYKQPHSLAVSLPAG